MLVSVRIVVLSEASTNAAARSKSLTCSAAVARSAYTIARTLFSLGDNAVSTLEAVRSKALC